ncbi:fumarate reductase subunit C [Photorhabdus luminescens]|uniref:Fumarate reductase subunit C n=2 Tax=Photorhabdus TaxID=29487 RepID=A0A022PQX7_9GAMM|nr:MULTISPECIES: fumarate reductase subunit FrdC [Photorhabdus]EYU16780.1 fumarate reductase subunit C [Photorhabdus aegyptia]QXF35385.1 fumarate reductase subunit C [Photorhabdus akhurstii]UJD77218.1 fumarate reductase subunit C [Photorhabdus luminescens]
MTTKRKPYIRSMAPNWWQKLSFYRFYILRESTAVTTMWFSILLIYGLFALKGGAQSWDEFVTFLKNPVILLINIITLLGALLHTKTWFELAPKAANIVIKGEKMGSGPVIKLLWTVTIIATMIILGIALF